MKVKVNLMEDKPKRKFMQTLLLSNLLNLPPSNPKPLARRLMEDSATSAEERITWRLNVSTGRKNLSKLNQEEMEEMADTRSTWWN